MLDEVFALLCESKACSNARLRDIHDRRRVAKNAQSSISYVAGVQNLTN